MSFACFVPLWDLWDLWGSKGHRLRKDDVFGLCLVGIGIISVIGETAPVPASVPRSAAFALPANAVTLENRERPASASVIHGYPRIVDGDTLAFGTTRVRLFGMDAFEQRQRCRRPIHNTAPDAAPLKFDTYRCGLQATEHLRALIGARPVTCVPRGRDPFQRIVAICSVEEASGETLDLGRAMVRDGWAVAFRKFSTMYVPDEEEARREHHGVWAASQETNDETLLFEWPWQWRYEERRDTQRRH
jgi:endonuclease YncB( thermonuclease family)